MQFSDLKLIDPLLRAVHSEGYDTPTPIQQQAIPHVLAGRDVLGCAQTGTGKTAAFALPIIQRLLATPRAGRPIRVLILAPTRELAAQIGESFDVYGKHTAIKQATIFGGVGQKAQTDALRRGVDVLVAAPGRLLDLMNQGYVRLDKVEIFVLDEADRMLDMGFIHDVKRVIAALPRQRQTLLFSATMPSEIQKLANDILHQPQYVEVTPVASTVEKIAQSVFMIPQKEKISLLRHLLADSSIKRVLVFTRTKHGANKVVDQLERNGIFAEAIHGNKSQNARERALAGFKDGSVRVLVATDIAARGIDVEEITHVIQYDLSHEPETYVHRIGRTARAGASGVAYAFCSDEERPLLRDIERLIRLHVPVAATPANLPAPTPTMISDNRSRAPQRPQGQAQGRSANGNNGGSSLSRSGQGNAAPFANRSDERPSNGNRNRRRRRSGNRMPNMAN
jgi:ATP-dependent RNA helicase RhlE